MTDHDQMRIRRVRAAVHRTVALLVAISVTAGCGTDTAATATTTTTTATTEAAPPVTALDTTTTFTEQPGTTSQATTPPPAPPTTIASPPVDLDELWARQLVQNDLCRGSNDPTVFEIACPLRDALLEEHFHAVVEAFIAAWDREDGEAMSTLTHPHHIPDPDRTIPDTLLAEHQPAGPFSCYYQSLAGETGCHFTVIDYPDDIYISFDVSYDHGWRALEIGLEF